MDTSAAACASDKAFLAEARKAISSPLLLKFQEVLQETELSGGCGALQLIDAQMASRDNGFSLGAAQLDLKQRPKEGWLLLQRLKADCSAQVSPELQLTFADDVVFNEKVLTRTTATLREDGPLWTKLLALRPKVEALLRSPCGQAIMLPQYTSHVGAGLERAAKTHDLLVKASPSLKAQDDFLWLYILDYGNIQQNFSNVETALATGAFCGPKLCAQKVTQPYRTAKPPIVTDLPRYALGYTCWGLVPEATRRRDALRRLNRVLQVAPLDMAALTPQDKAWASAELAGILAQARADFPGASFLALEALVAGTGGKLPPTPTPTPAANLAKLQMVCAKS